MTDRSVTYGSYLAVDELLALQRPRSEGPEHDEMLFIVIHQVYELWFKQVLHEIDHVIDLLAAREPHRAQAGTPNARTSRSEERRVGKECRDMWEPDDEDSI